MLDVFLVRDGKVAYVIESTAAAVEVCLEEAATNYSWWWHKVNTHNPDRVVWNGGVGRIDSSEGLNTVRDRVQTALAPDLWVGARFENIDL